MTRVHARALVRCRPQVRAVSTVAQAGHSSARTAWSFRGPSFARYWLPASWGAASAALRASSTSNVGAVSSREESLARLVGKGEGSEPLSRQELRALSSTTEGLEAMQLEELVAWVNRWAELDKASLSSEVTRVPPPELCHVIRHIITRLGDTDGQGDTWSPGQCARLFLPLGHVHYYWEGKEKEDMHALAALLALRIHGPRGKGWRKLSASEISELSAGLGQLELSHMGVLLGDIEDECLRRGLDKFKARDLGNLLYGFTTFSQQPGPELMAAIEERVGRRGYLKGRNGDTTPTDVVRLLRGLSMLKDKLSPELMERIVEQVGKDDGFMAALEDRGLAGLFYGCSWLEGEGAQAVMAKALQELDDRTGGLHRADVSIDVLMRVVSGLAHARDVEQGSEVLGRVLGRVLAEEEGQSSLQPRQLSSLLRAASRFGLVDDYKPLLDRLAYDLQMQGFADTPMYFLVAQQLRQLHKAGRYVGHDVMDMAVQKFLELAPEEGPMQQWGRGGTADFLREVRFAQRHGYRPPAVLVETILQWCAKVDTANVRDVVILHRCLDMLCHVLSFMDEYKVPVALVEGLVEGLYTGHRARELMAHEEADREKLLQSVLLLCKAAEGGVKHGRPSPLVQVRTALGKLLDEAAAQHAEEGLGKRGLLGGLSISELELLEEPALQDKLRLIVLRDVQTALAVVRGWGASPLEERLAAAPLVLHCLQRLTRPRWRKLLGPEEYDTLAVAALEELEMHGLEVLEKRPEIVPGLLGLLARLKVPLPSGLLQSLIQAGKQELIQVPTVKLLWLLNRLHALPDDPPAFDTPSPEALSSLASLGVSPDLPLPELVSTLIGLARLQAQPDPAYVAALVGQLEEAEVQALWPAAAAALVWARTVLGHPPSSSQLQALFDVIAQGVSEGEDGTVTLSPGLRRLGRTKTAGLLEVLPSLDPPPPPRLLNGLASLCIYSRLLDPSLSGFQPLRLRVVVRALSQLPHATNEGGQMTSLLHALSAALWLTKMEGFDSMDVAQSFALFVRYNRRPSSDVVRAAMHVYSLGQGQGAQGLEPTPASVPVLLQACAVLSSRQRLSIASQDEWADFVGRQVEALFVKHGDTCTSEQASVCLASLQRMGMLLGNEPLVRRVFPLCVSRLDYQHLDETVPRCLLRSAFKHNVHLGSRMRRWMGRACRVRGLGHVVEELAVVYGAIKDPETTAGQETPEGEDKPTREAQHWIARRPEGKRFLLEVLADTQRSKEDLDGNVASSVRVGRGNV